jgi:PEP-CTERM motif
VPEPSSLLLSGIGLAALIGLARRYRAGGQNAPV